MYHLFCNALVHVIYWGVSGQCLYTIYLYQISISYVKETYIAYFGHFFIYMYSFSFQLVQP